MGNIIEVENLSKRYRLGQIGSGTISQDLSRAVARLRGKEDPTLKVTEKNRRSESTDANFVWALNDVSFSLKAGEVLGIVGKNGAGKSTLLKLLSRITTPTSGSIKMKGRVASLLEVGTGFHMELTGRENIFLNGAILGMTKEEIKGSLDEIIEFSGCAQYIDTPVKRYSSGMIVRLGFAVAAHLNSEILIVDEVLAVGDQEFQQKCIGKMQEISGSGRAVLFVSHNLSSVKKLCKTGILLEEGECVFQGEINDVVERYLGNNKSTEEQFFNLDKLDKAVEVAREGTGEVYFKSLETFCNNAPSANVMIGDELGLELTICSTELKKFKVSIYIYKYDETLLSNVENSDSDFYFEPFTGEKKFMVKFKDIRFYTGSYKIGLWIGEPGSGAHIDLLRFCAYFNVVEGSNLVKRSLPPNSGVFYLQPDWSQTK